MKHKTSFNALEALLLKQNTPTILESENLNLKNSWYNLKFGRYKCSEEEIVLRKTPAGNFFDPMCKFQIHKAIC